MCLLGFRLHNAALNRQVPSALCLDNNSFRITIGLRLRINICSSHICQCLSQVDSQMNSITKARLVRSNSINIPVVLKPVGSFGRMKNESMVCHRSPGRRAVYYSGKQLALALWTELTFPFFAMKTTGPWSSDAIRFFDASVKWFQWKRTNHDYDHMHNKDWKGDKMNGIFYLWCDIWFEWMTDMLMKFECWQMNIFNKGEFEHKELKHTFGFTRYRRLDENTVAFWCDYIICYRQRS